MKKILIISIIITAILISCLTLRELVSFSKCDFRLKSVQKITLAGVNLNNKSTINDFNLADMASLTQHAIRGNLPMIFTLNLEARNPNSQQAAIDKIEWIALIDGNEIVSGFLNQKIVIPANNGLEIIPLNFQIDLVKIINSSSGNAIANLALNLMDIGNTSSKLTIKIKPTITISSFALNYPGYITITKEFSSGS